MAIDDKKLDNPVWYSLTETHRPFAINYPDIKFYHPDYCPFGGFVTGEDTPGSIDAYARICDNFYVVGERPAFSGALNLKKDLVCRQMVIDNKIDLVITEDIQELGQDHSEELFRLVDLVQPGYFKINTWKLGRYYGIFKDDALIAVTGERMKMHQYTEVSAVVTHPEHTGKGYAKQLVAHAVNNIFNEKKNPFLHVAATNTSAIKLYEKLGFRTRRMISFWNLGVVDSAI